jgi:hypothetical protein
MKKQLVIVGIAILIVIVGLSGCIGPAQSIYARRLNKEADNFVNMTEEQMKNFPLLKESILTNKSIDKAYPSEEIIKLDGILEYFNTNVIYYQDEYYEIQFTATD